MDDKELTFEQWADLIDEAKSRSAAGDLSCIAYRMLNVINELKQA